MTVAAPSDDASQYRLLHLGAFMAMVCIGTYSASFGTAGKFIARDVDVSLGTAGLILSAFFLGSISASGAISVALHGHDSRLLTAIGAAAAAAGALGLGLAPNFALTLACAVLMGLGDGLLVAATHIIMARTSHDVPRAINDLNLWFAVGAVASPLWTGAILQLTEERAYVFGGIAAMLAVTFATLWMAGGSIREELSTPAEEFKLPGNRTAWVMGVVLFLYVGAEFGLGSWVSEYAQRSADASVFGGAALTSGYWGALLIGRLVSGWYFARQSDAGLMLLISIAGAGLASVVLAITTGNIVLSAAAAFAAGLSLGPVWPATVAIASEGGEASAIAATATMGNAGGLVLPWAQGRVLVGSGPAAGVAVTAVLCGLMFGIVSVFRGQRRRLAD